MASSEDVRLLVERLAAMETVLIDQQQRSQEAERQLEIMRAREPQRRPGAGAELIDTRVLGRPMTFDGKELHWRSFKFQFAAYCGALDRRLRELLTLAENHTAPELRNTVLGPDAQLYYMLIMICQENAQRLLEHAGDTEGAVA